MSGVEVNCPSCGAPIRFAIGSSIVVICPNCRSAVARSDRDLDDLGKVAAIVDTGSPLEVGRTGTFRGMPFVLTGRAQFAHEAGGVWDEWYASFPADRWGWLAEAQGRFYLTFERRLAPSAHLPPLESNRLGERITLPGVGLFVAGEIGEATARSAEGEIPYKLRPGERLSYVDLTGPGGKFATFDYSDDPPRLYLGDEVTLDELGISPTAATEREPKHVGALQVNCPNCGGALELKAPDAAERVVCPYCQSLLDCTQGKLEFLKSLKPDKVFAPTLPLGSIGTLDGQSYTVIGFMTRHTTYERTNYYWNEYLLYTAGVGFRWLVESDHHWSFVKGIPAADAEVYGRDARYAGKHFRLFEKAVATVDYVVGEFYWKVHLGEQVAVNDYVAAPLILSREMSASNDAVKIGDSLSFLQSRGEVNWSVGVYKTAAEIGAAFKVARMPAPRGVGANQPFNTGKIYPLWAALTIVALAIWLSLSMMLPTRKLVERSFTLRPPPIGSDAAATATGESGNTRFISPIEIDGHRAVHITVRSAVSNTWLYVDGDLFNEETGLVQPFAVEVSYYFGTDSDGSWSEGSQTNDAYISAVPPGKYTLRIEGEWEHMNAPIDVTVRVDEAGPRLLHLVAVLVVLSILPTITLVRQYLFERQRWANSDFSPYSTS